MIDPAAVVADEHIGPGQCRYVATRSWWMANFGTTRRRYNYLEEHFCQEWIPADQSRDWLLERRLTGRRIWLKGTPEQAAADGFDDRDVWPTGTWRVPYGDFFAADAGRHPAPREGCWQIPTPGFLAAMPRDPVQLYERLKADSPSDRPGYTGALTYAMDALRSGLVPADVRAALYRVLLMLPGMTISEADTDERLRISLTHDDGTYRTEILIDPANGQFAGDRQVLSRDARGLKTGTIIGSSVVRVATVDAIGALPPPA